MATHNPLRFGYMLRKTPNHIKGCNLITHMDPVDRILLRSSPIENIGPEMGMMVGRALAMDFKRIVVAKDLMKSSSMMKEALMSGILSAGSDVIDIGVTTAPATAMAASLGDCAVYVTEYLGYGMTSGYILINQDGSQFRIDQLRRLDRVFLDPPALPGAGELGRVRRHDLITEEYNSKLKNVVPKNPGCSVILDCGCGPVADSAPQILNAVGAEVLTLNAQNDREYRADEPDEDGLNTTDVKNLVHSNPGCIGIAMNRIGTMMTVIDEKGMEVTPQETFAIIVQKLKPESIAVPINTTLTITDSFKDLWDDAESRIVLTDIDAGSVCNAVASGADMGFFEGGIIFGDVSMMPDGIHAAAIISEIAGNESINTLTKNLTSCYSDSSSRTCQCTADSFIRVLETCLKNVDGTLHTATDTWRVDMDDGWFLIAIDRGEELSIDISAESRDRAYLIGLMEIAEDLVEECTRGQ